MKLLVIRFSSFGDIVHAIAVPRAFIIAYPGSSVDWLTRDDYASLLREQASIAQVISYSRASGFAGLIRLAWQISRADYTHVYDAHSNLRSTCLMLSLRALSCLRLGISTRFVTRPKNRIRRFLFFRFRLPVLPTPFRGADSYHRPLMKWRLPARVPNGAQFFLAASHLPTDIRSEISEVRANVKHLVTLAAAAAWEMKRWPVEHWKHLIRLMPDVAFVLLGGREDTFLEALRVEAPERVLNLSGKLSLIQSCAVIEISDLVISNDTGLLHVADQMNRPTIALMGPTAFGYPSHPTSVTLERRLSCQPCSKDGRGGCVNSVYKRCLIEIEPSQVVREAYQILSRTIPVQSDPA